MYNEDFVLMSLGDNNREAVRRNYVLLDYLSGAIARAVSALLAMFVSRYSRRVLVLGQFQSYTDQGYGVAEHGYALAVALGSPMQPVQLVS